jgi:hypothetical protein
VAIHAVHLVPQPLWPFEIWRRREVRYLVKRLQLRGDVPQIVAGDFNALLPGDPQRREGAPSWIRAQWLLQGGTTPRWALKPLIDAGYTVAVLPDFVRETFTPGTDDGGHDASDGRGLRYLEWRWDPDPDDDTYLVDYAFLLRDATGSVRVVHDRHVEGLFARAQWLAWFEAAGLSASSTLDAWGRDVFLAKRETKRTVTISDRQL